MPTLEFALVESSKFTVLCAAVFISLHFVMPMWTWWNKTLNKNTKTEYMMRMIAITLEFISSVQWAYALFIQTEGSYDWALPYFYATLGYWVYDFVANIYYYRDLKKLFVLVHHFGCYITGMGVIITWIPRISMVFGFSGFVTDVFDHATWFLQRQEIAPRFVSRLKIFNTLLFFVARLVIAPVWFYRLFTTDPLFLASSTLIQGWIMVTLIVYSLLNVHMFVNVRLPNMLKKRSHVHAH